MVTDPNERLRRSLTGRDMSVVVSKGEESRLRMWIDRFNARAGREPGHVADDLLDPDSDTDVIIALMCCAREGLRADEDEHALEGFEWGDVVSRELADEMRRRRVL